MNGTTYQATVINGHVVLSANVRLPENAQVLVVVPTEGEVAAHRVHSPRLVNPDQAADFKMDVSETPDAGI